MLSGLLLIALGVLIYLHPKILVAMLAGAMIATGVGLMLLRWRLRRMFGAAGQAAPTGWTRFLIRF